MKRPQLSTITILPALFLLAGCTDAPSDQPAATPDITSPYVGLETRDIKSLSETQVDEYLTGKGLGFALVAELNQYPGPRHVLDAVDQMDLTDEQKTEVQALFDEMQTEAVTLGRQVVDLEAELNALFADDRATEEQVEALIGKIGRLNARLRYVHVRTHLEMKEILTEAQVQRYNELRGYEDESEAGHIHTPGMEHGT